MIITIVIKKLISLHYPEYTINTFMGKNTRIKI